MNDPVQDIKSRLSIDHVVAPYVQLKKAGRSFKGLCPFHNEKTPSFVVSPERQLAYCFGCNKGGDMFSFIQEIEGVDFKGAMNLLAEKAGLDLSQYQTTSFEARVSKDERDIYYEVNESVQRYYAEQLATTKPGADALKYLEGRGFTAEAIRQFGLGLSPDSFEATFNFLTSKRYQKKTLLDVGLLVSKDTASDRTYDRFRGRLMFPIHDPQGRIVGFGGRALKPDDQPKYLNSPESAIYHKSKVLYGFHKAKKAIRDADLCVVVEGYMDVMASHQAGIANVVASSGTALTMEQLKLIKRFTKNVAFAFDTDQAGEDALRRAIELGQQEEMHMQVIRVPEGKDPDECVQKDPELWRTAITSAPHYLAYYLDRVTEIYPVNTVEGKQAATAAFLPLLRYAGSIERDHFIQQLGFRLKLDPRVVYDQFNALRKQKGLNYAPQPVAEPQPVVSTAQITSSTAGYFLGLLMRFPESVVESAFALNDELFDSPLKKVYNSLSDLYNDGAFENLAAWLETLDESTRQLVDVLILFAESRNADLTEAVIQDELTRVIDQLKKDHFKQQAANLMHQIRLAQKENDAERERELFQEYSRLYQ
jgi:DNA primase